MSWRLPHDRAAGSCRSRSRFARYKETSRPGAAGKELVASHRPKVDAAAHSLASSRYISPRLAIPLAQFLAEQAPFGHAVDVLAREATVAVAGILASAAADVDMVGVAIKAAVVAGTDIAAGAFATRLVSAGRNDFSTR